MLEFQFVDNSAIDAAARKKIRRRVMIGKNTGKKRSKLEKTAKSSVVLTWKRNESSSTESDNSSKILFPMPPHLFNDVSTLRYPGEVGAPERDLVRQFVYFTGDIIYPKELYLNPTIAFSMWMEWFQTSEAVFHCLLAMAEGLKLLLLGKQDWTPRLIKSLAQTYRAINENLKNDEIPSDATVATVMSIAMHENLMGAPGRAKVHLEALGRMVNLKGGIYTFTGSKALQQKVTRTDLEYALQSGARPRFSYNNFPRHVLRGDVTRYEAPMVANHELQEILDDFLSASRLLNDYQSEPQVDPFAFQDILITTSYRIIHLCPLGDAAILNSVDEAFQIGMIALIASMFIRYRHGPQGTPYYLLSARLRATIDRLAGTDNTELKLWVLFAGGVFVLNPYIGTWIYPQIQMCVSSLGLETWKDVHTRLLEYPWIRFFHDQSGEDLYKKATLAT